MKYIKKFENKYQPKIGDYVICNIETSNFEELETYLSQNVGEDLYLINNDYIRLATPEEIKQQEIKNSVNKYNL